MAGKFVGASTQYLTNTTTPIPPLVATGTPMTMGAWFNLAAVGAVARSIMSFSDTAASLNYLWFSMDASELLRASINGAGTSDNTAILTTPIVAGAWVFAVARFISATNRRISGLYSNSGVVEHGASAVSISPVGLDRVSIGALVTTSANNPWDGLIAEAWYTNTDIQADGLQLNGDTLRQLAYGGPFSIPHIKNDIVEYHSFRNHLSSDTFDNENDLLPILGETLVNTAGVTLGVHPPLPYWYVNPKDHSIPFII